MKRLALFLFLFGCGGAVGVMEPASKTEHIPSLYTNRVEWEEALITYGIGPSTGAYALPEYNPSLNSLLIIGDSISEGYTEPLRNALNGRLNVFRIPTNGRATFEAMPYLNDWIRDGVFTYLFINFGLHDLEVINGAPATTLKDYESNLRDILKTLAGHGSPIIITTTPVPDSAPARLHVEPYNDVLEGLGLPILDLNSFMLGYEDLHITPSNIHYTLAGYEKAAEFLAREFL